MHGLNEVGHFADSVGIGGEGGRVDDETLAVSELPLLSAEVKATRL